MVGIFINIFFLTLYTFLRPYKEEELTFGSFLGQCQLIMIFFISILFKEKVDISHFFIDTMLVLCIFAGVFYEFFANPISKYYSRKVGNVHQATRIPAYDIELSEKDVILREEALVL